MTRSPRILLFAAILVGSACTEDVGRWKGVPTPIPHVQQTYYAGVDGMPVRESPSADAKVIGSLRLHERVTRLQVHQGWAQVIVVRTSLTGWVDHGRLLGRLPPPAPKRAPAAPSRPRGAVTAPAAAPTPLATTDPTVAPTAESSATPVFEPTPTPTAARTAASPTPAGDGPSVFDAY